jgi:hypothetical protein
VIKVVDNCAAISRINKMQQKGSSRWHYSDDVDIMAIIVDCMKESTLWHQLRWVKAHQDEKRPYEELDIWGQMNCNTNQVATIFCTCINNGEGGILHWRHGHGHYCWWQKDYLPCPP